MNVNSGRERRYISWKQDIIDSRDVIKRLEELDYLREMIDRKDELEAKQDTLTEEEKQEFESLSSDIECEDVGELLSLEDLQEEGEGSPDWNHGTTLIRDTYFEEYAQQLAEDIGAVNADSTWPNCHIDWEAAADSLKADYLCVDYDGVEYWIRA